MLPKLFGIDTRSLAVFRIGLGAVVLLDLAVRASDLGAFYTDAGVLPRTVWLERMTSSWTLSIHLMSGGAGVQGLLFVLQAVCAVGLLLGWRTRTMAALSWFLMASLQRRNHLVLGGADNYLRMMLGWGVLLPLGAQWSLDRAAQKAPQRRPVQVLSWATAGILLQTGLLYVITALYKWRGETWQEGSALYYALNLDLYAKESAAWLLQFPAFLNVLTHAVMWFELLGPLVLFAPVWTGPIRTMASLGFVLMHLGINSLFYLDLFPAVSTVAIALFLPAWFWDRVLRHPQRARPIVTGQARAVNATAAVLLVLVFWVVLSKFAPAHVRLPTVLQHAGTMGYVDQTWTMFAPNPPRKSSWLAAPGRLRDGSQVDLVRGGAAMSWERPAKREMFANERWRKYLVHFVMRKDRRVAGDYAQYLCRLWNASHTGPRRLESLELVIMSRSTPPAGPAGAYTPETLLTHTCQSPPRPVKAR